MYSSITQHIRENIFRYCSGLLATGRQECRGQTEQREQQRCPPCWVMDWISRWSCASGRRFKSEGRGVNIVDIVAYILGLLTLIGCVVIVVSTRFACCPSTSSLTCIHLLLYLNRFFQRQFDCPRNGDDGCWILRSTSCAVFHSYKTNTSEPVMYLSEDENKLIYIYIYEVGDGGGFASVHLSRWVDIGECGRSWSIVRARNIKL